MRFRYLLDPLFLFCLVTYFVNRFVFKAIWKGGFVHDHLNDLICIPFWVPIMLFAQKMARLRPTDDRPHAGEIVIPLILWSWIFEILLPAAGWCPPRAGSEIEASRTTWTSSITHSAP
jgi:hypothetical protein